MAVQSDNATEPYRHLPQVGHQVADRIARLAVLVIELVVAEDHQEAEQLAEPVGAWRCAAPPRVRRRPAVQSTGHASLGRQTCSPLRFL